MTDKPKKTEKKAKPAKTELSDEELDKVEGGLSLGTRFNTVTGGNIFNTANNGLVANTADGGLVGNTADGIFKGTDQLKR